MLRYPNVEFPSLAAILPGFFPAGFAVTVWELPEELPTSSLDAYGAVIPEALSWDLGSYLSSQPARLPSDPWLACVLVAGRLSGDGGANGILIDADPRFEAVGYQRAGCGVFVGRTGVDWLFYRTVVHELGHVLNLDHADAGPGCVMHSSPGLYNESIEFSLLPTAHLLTHQEPEVRPGPGDLVFGDVRDAHPSREGNPYSRSVPTVSLRLGGRLKSRKGRPAGFTIGEPPTLQTTVRNGGRTSRNVECNEQRRLRTRIQVRVPGGTWQDVAPRRVVCSDARLVLRAGRTVTRTALLPQRPANILTTPGLFELRTVVQIGGRRIASEPVQLEALTAPRGRALLARRCLQPWAVKSVERGYVPSNRRPGVKQLIHDLPRDHSLRSALLLALGRSSAERARSSRGVNEARRLLRMAAKDKQSPFRTAALRLLRVLDSKKKKRSDN